MTTLLEIEPEYLEPLRAAGLADFDAFMRAPAGPPASKHKHRETVPLDIPIDGILKRFFLKRVFHVPPRHALGPLLRLKPGLSQPRYEWEILKKLREAGIPAMKRVAMGERRLAGVPVSAFLLVAAVPMRYTLENWLVPGFGKPDAPLQTPERSRLLYELGRQIMLLHGGFRWPDLHPKHIFAEPSATPQKRWTWEFCLIDVERMCHNGDWFGIEVSQGYVPIDETALEDLTSFLCSLRPLRLSRTEVMRLWAGYCSTSRRIVRQTLGRGRHWLPSWAALDDGPRLPDDFENPRAVRSICSNEITADNRAQTMLGRAGIRRLDDVFSIQGNELRKAGLETHRDRIRLEISDGNGSTQSLYLKRFRTPAVVPQIRRIFATGSRHGSAYLEKYFIKRLSLLGVPTLRTLAFGEEMFGPWERRSVIITAGIDGISLETMLLRAAADRRQVPSWPDRREIIRQLALIVRLLHRNQLFHRDLYLSHIFLTRNADGGIVLRVIDLARMIEKPHRTRRWRIKDLAALNYSATAPLVTRADCLRFMQTYCGKETSRETLRRELAAIAARARRIARHDARRRARLSTGAPA